MAWGAEAKERRAALAMTCPACGSISRRGEWPRTPRGELRKTCCGGATAPKSREHKLSKKRDRGRKYERKRGRLERADLHLLYRWHRAMRERRKRWDRRFPLHEQHVRDWRKDNTRQWRWRYRYRPETRLRELLRTQLRKTKRFARLGESLRLALRGSGGAGVEALVGYSICDLRVHLERRFTDGMSWEAFHRGEIHIDHITPKSLMPMETIDDLRACWALDNLQPLWARDNLRKGATAAPHEQARFSVGSTPTSGASTRVFVKGIHNRRWLWL